jgi:hypothetical protein
VAQRRKRDLERGDFDWPTAAAVGRARAVATQTPDRGLAPRDGAAGGGEGVAHEGKVNAVTTIE